MRTAPPARAWCFTIYGQTHFEQWFETNWPSLSELVRYCCFQKESCPDTQRLHYQGYVECRRPLRFSALGRAGFPNDTHYERRLGTRDEARNYCRKPETRVAGPWEFGEWQSGGAGTRNDLTGLYETVTEGIGRGQSGHQIWTTVYDKHFKAGILYSNGISRFIASRYRSPRADPPRVTVYQGSTGSGKTRAVYAAEANLWRAPPATSGSALWFDGWSGHDAALFDDFDGTSIKLPLLLQLIDRYDMDVPVKGAFTYWNPKRVYFTTNIPVNLWYDGQDNKHIAAMERRIDAVFDFDVDKETPLDFDKWRRFYTG